MQLRDWLTIAIFAAGATFAAAGFLLRRLLQSVDEHDKAIKALCEELPLYVKRETHDVANAEMVNHMERLRLEGSAREARIIDAIERVGVRSDRDVRDIRSEIAATNARLDRVKENHGDRSRRS